MLRIISGSERETRLAGEKFSGFLSRGDVVLLNGPLGSGKTVFAKGILRGFGFDEKKVKSPSFILVREYKTKKYPVYHLDLYRIKSPGELVDLGYEDYFYSPGGVTLIEWPSRAADFIREGFSVSISYSGKDRRILEFEEKNRDKIIMDL